MPLVMDKSQSKKGAAVSEELVLFHWTSVGYL